MPVSLISVEILDLCSQLNPHAGTPAFLFFRYGFKLTFQLIPRSSHLNACQASFSVIEWPLASSYPFFSPCYLVVVMCPQCFSLWAKLWACVSPKVPAAPPLSWRQGTTSSVQTQRTYKKTEHDFAKFFFRALPLRAHSRNHLKRRSVFTVFSLFNAPLFNSSSLERASRQVNLLGYSAASSYVLSA